MEVDRCHPYHCPWCTPDSYNKNINYCEAISGLKIRAVKTFPRTCPLTRIEGLGIPVIDGSKLKLEERLILEV